MVRIDRAQPIWVRLVLSTIVLLAGSWSVYHNWPQRTIRFQSYLYTDVEARRLHRYPQAQFDYGMHFWRLRNPEQAARFFRQAVSQSELFFDGWLRLAEAEAALGRKEKARDILIFSVSKTESVLRWRWPQMLLARELGMETLFFRSAADLLSRRVFEDDTLQLLHTHFGGAAASVISVLQPDHWERYLDWLMRWGLTDESVVVWQAMTRAGPPANETALRLAHFLLERKRIGASADIWQAYTGIRGLTNPGFEEAITDRGFDWRHIRGQNDGWTLKRVSDTAVEGRYALKLTFKGLANIDFYHFYQIFPTNPQARYRLTYAWKSNAITTDQGLFVEVFCYDSHGFYQAGPMMTGTHAWREQSIGFAVSEACHAAVVRLRRLPSMRFDSKLDGQLWIDHFRLEKMARDFPAPAAESPGDF